MKENVVSSCDGRIDLLLTVFGDSHDFHERLVVPVEAVHMQALSVLPHVHVSRVHAALAHTIF